MTRDEAVALIKQQYGFRTDLDTTIVTNMQLAQTMLETGPTKPWFMRSERSTKVTDISEPRVLLPSDFIEEVDDEGLMYIPDDEDEDEVQLFKDELDELQRAYLGEDEGAPAAYAISGEYFWIFPTPDAAYTLRMVYYQRQTSLDSNVENNWLKWVPYLLMGTAGWQVATSLRDAGATATFKEWIAAGLKTLAAQNASREVANRQLQMGGRHV